MTLDSWGDSVTGSAVPRWPAIDRGTAAMLLVAAVWGPLDFAVTLAAPQLVANPLVVLLGPVAWLASKAIVVGLTVWVWYSARRVVRKRVLVDTWIAVLAAVGAVPVGFTAAVLAGVAV